MHHDIRDSQWAGAPVQFVASLSNGPFVTGTHCRRWKEDMWVIIELFGDESVVRHIVYVIYTVARI